MLDADGAGAAVRALRGHPAAARLAADPLRDAAGRRRGVVPRDDREACASACRTIAIRTTFIVGFPGRGRGASSASSCEFVREAELDNVGAFTYSPEPGSGSEPLGDPVPDGGEGAAEGLPAVAPAADRADASCGRCAAATVEAIVEGPSRGDGVPARGPAALAGARDRRTAPDHRHGRPDAASRRDVVACADREDVRLRLGRRRRRLSFAAGRWRSCRRGRRGPILGIWAGWSRRVVVLASAAMALPATTSNPWIAWAARPAARALGRGLVPERSRSRATGTIRPCRRTTSASIRSTPSPRRAVSRRPPCAAAPDRDRPVAPLPREQRCCWSETSSRSGEGPASARLGVAAILLYPTAFFPRVVLLGVALSPPGRGVPLGRAARAMGSLPARGAFAACLTRFNGFLLRPGAWLWSALEARREGGSGSPRRAGPRPIAAALAGAAGISRPTSGDAGEIRSSTCTARPRAGRRTRRRSGSWRATSSTSPPAPAGARAGRQAHAVASRSPRRSCSSS